MAKKRAYKSDTHHLVVRIQKSKKEVFLSIRCEVMGGYVNSRIKVLLLRSGPCGVHTQIRVHRPTL
jgi:hypothetical protein